MDIQQLSDLILKNRLLVFSVIKTKKHVQTEVLEDAFSIATLKILEQQQNIKIENITAELLRLTYKEIGKEYKQQQEAQKYLLQGSRHHDKLDWNKLDKRIINRLTPRQKTIYKYRCKRIPPSKMPVQYSTQNISRISYLIIKKYKKFLLTTQSIRKEDVDKLPLYLQPTFLLYLQGYTHDAIATKLNKSISYIRYLICIGKAQLNQTEHSYEPD